jgi:hypothetical protein
MAQLLEFDGDEFFLSEVDDFEAEVATLRASPAFQQFLDERSPPQRRFSLEEIERKIDEELAVIAPSNNVQLGKGLAVAVKRTNTIVEDQTKRLASMSDEEWQEPFNALIETAHVHPAAVDITLITDDNY